MKKTKLPSYITILVLTLLTVVVWIAFSIYRALTTKPEPVVPAEISQLLTPSLDKETINLIQTRVFIDDTEIEDNVVNVTTSKAVPTPVSTIAPSPVATSSAQTATQSATVSEQ